MNDTFLVRARALAKEYGKGAALVRAVDQVDLDVERGETVAIVGPSGCGKSTLLHLLGGLERPSHGELRLAGQRVDKMGETALARLRRARHRGRPGQPRAPARRPCRIPWRARGRVPKRCRS